MKFANVEEMRIPKRVRRIRHNGKVLFSPYISRYVSLGDSIAAGHTINENWETDYGYDSQYGKNGNTETVIVPGCYTDLIHHDLIERTGGRVKATSFARSGDTVADLMEKLNHDVVKRHIAKADYVTICIGANDVLEPAMSHLDEYINTGDLSTIAAIVEANLAVLADDSNANSYTALFNKLKSINPNAKYVFTTIYNPYKYLWIEEGHHGFFKPIMDAIPTMEFLGIDFDSFIKDSLLGTPIVQQLFDRVNGLDDWAEKYVTQLNTVLRNKITAYGNANFLLADTKAVYDPVPDRPITAPKHYNDLVSVEYTRDYDTAQMDWGRLWAGSSASDFWWGLANKHGLDIDGLASDFVAQTIEKVIVPDIDPHPEEYGHHALRCSFADALGLATLPRRTITFNANGGTGTMATQTVIALDNYTAYANINALGFNPGAEGYCFTGWNTAAAGGGTSYSNNQFVGLSGNLTLYAQWSNIYTIAYRKLSANEYVSPSGETGPVTKDGSEYYLRVTLGGTVIDGLRDKFDSDGASPIRTVQVPYGTELYIQLINTGEADRGAVYLNNNKVAGNSEYCYYTMPVKNDMTMEFTWEQESVLADVQSYWIARLVEYPR